MYENDTSRYDVVTDKNGHWFTVMPNEKNYGHDLDFIASFPTHLAAVEYIMFNNKEVTASWDIAALRERFIYRDENSEEYEFKEYYLNG